MIDLDKKLSAHFTIGEMIRTSHRNIDNTPTLDIIDKLTHICEFMLEPIREQFGPLWVTSGYRCLALNNAVDGSKNSAHMYGCAADIVPIWDVPTETIVRWVSGSELAFDQIIDEHSKTSNWIHIGQPRPGAVPRREVLTMVNGIYAPFWV